MDHPIPTPDIAAPDAEPVLDADIVDLLNGSATASTQGDALSMARVKRRVLARVAEDQRGQHLTVRAADGQWQPFGPGLSLKVLHECEGIMSYLIRLAPGASLPAHRHPIDEECVVLEGALRIGELEVGAGGFHLGRQDKLHMPIVSEKGALIFLRGAAPEATLLV
ncbi:cupin domain-containing protein [Aquabacterium sp.]|uniref:cupin domain-containing protein n=1 Tax=Aquabacterium sp. TaxID=1872578 RepID=UPI002C0B11FD|nr:cupin domain-containing protein [Aquabacterium sp.]HSW06388.1 cupin domain-containing protein [Aquabacterium sp.]